LERALHDEARANTFFTRNPYLFGDMTWGWMYVLHGLAGIGFVSLVTAHIYFAIRPEKLFSPSQ